MSLLQLLPPSTRRAAQRWLGAAFQVEPEVCIPREMHGSNGGVWCVAAQRLTRDSLVYSFGVGADISFDVSLIETYGLKVVAFDPTPASLQWLQSQHVPAQMRVIPCGLADFDGIARFNPAVDPRDISHTILDRPTKDQAIQVPVRRLEFIMDELGHGRVDLVKMNIEGAEFDVIDDMIQSHIRPTQLLVSFHHYFPGAGVRRTQKTLRQLGDAGYRLFHVAQTQMEFSFILESAEAAK